jgi:hypothetical protein
VDQLFIDSANLLMSNRYFCNLNAITWLPNLFGIKGFVIVVVVECNSQQDLNPYEKMNGIKRQIVLKESKLV